MYTYRCTHADKLLDYRYLGLDIQVYIQITEQIKKQYIHMGGCQKIVEKIVVPFWSLV